MISLAACWLFTFLFDFLSTLNAFFDCAFRSLARSGLIGFGPRGGPSGRSRGGEGVLGTLLERFWAILAVLGTILVALERSKVPVARFWIDLGLDFGTILDRFCKSFFGDV